MGVVVDAARFPAPLLLRARYSAGFLPALTLGLTLAAGAVVSLSWQGVGGQESAIFGAIVASVLLAESSGLPKRSRGRVIVNSRGESWLVLPALVLCGGDGRDVPQPLRLRHRVMAVNRIQRLFVQRQDGAMREVARGALEAPEAHGDISKIGIERLAGQVIVVPVNDGPLAMRAGAALQLIKAFSGLARG